MLSDRILTPQESLAVRILMDRLGLDVPSLAGSTDVHEAILQVANVSYQAGYERCGLQEIADALGCDASTLEAIVKTMSGSGTE